MKLPVKPQWPRARDLPEAERKAFGEWLCGQTRPWLENTPDSEQDAYYAWDYKRWKEGKPVID